MTIEALTLLLIGSLLTFLTTNFFAQKKHRLDLAAEVERERRKAAETIANEKRDSDQRITDLERKLGLVEHSVQPINAAFQALLIKELTHYHTPEMDALLVKLADETLNEAETERLTVLLEQRTRDMADEITDSERDAAHILPFIVKRVRAEAEADPAPALQVVAVPADPASGDDVNGN